MLTTQLLPGGLIRTCSDKSMKIRQIGTGVEYAEAIDPVDSGRTYTETATPIKVTDVVGDLAQAPAAL